MLTEWIRAIFIFARKGYHAITTDVNNNGFSEKFCQNLWNSLK